MQNFFDQFDAPPSNNPAPANPPAFIPGTRKQPTQIQQNADQRAADANARAERAEQRAHEAQARSNAANARSQTEFENKQADREAAGGVSASVEQGRAASFFSRAQSANADYEAAGLDPDSIIGKSASAIAPDVTSYFSSDARNAQRGRELDFIGAVLRYESGAAIPPSEIESAYKIYFPTPGAGPEEIESKRKARQTVMEGLRIGAGPAAALAGSPEQAPEQDLGITVDLANADENGVITNEAPGTPDGSSVAASDPRLVGFREEYPDAATVHLDGSGKPFAYETVDGDWVGVVSGSAHLDDEYDARVQRGADRREKELGDAGFGKRTESGLTFGLSDELAGAGYSLGRLLQGDTGIADNYAIGRDVDRELYRRADERTGFAGDALELTSALATPGGAVNTIRRAAGVGAGFGGVGGFGYGEGAEGSAVNALIGTGAGALVGAGGQKFVNALTSRAAARPNARAISDAGNAEGVTVNRAMVDKNLQPKFTGSAGTMVGSRKIQRELSEVGGQIEGRVADLGAGGTARVTETGGDLVETAAKRAIDRTGKIAKRKYDRAEKLAGDAKILPKQSLAVVDDAIKTLSETPGINSAEIKFLGTLKGDLGENLSVGALRRMRTGLRDKIRRGELTFGEDEARVLSIMDTAADDIRAGLTAQGKVGAARAFDVADKAYRARQEFITETIQKVIGKRNSPLSSEQIFRKFKAMATPGGDAKGLRKLYATLDADEAADIAATFAESLGKNTKGEFSTAHFVTQVQKLPESARAAIFGKEGAQSIKNLTLLSKEHSRLAGAAGGSQTGLRMDFKGWLSNLLIGGGLGTAVDGVTTGGVVAAGAVGTKLLRDWNSARLLMSPKITRWIQTAPKTADGRAIDNHFNRLGQIAKAEPALAGDVKSLQELILKSANDNAYRAAAEGGERQVNRVGE